MKPAALTLGLALFSAAICACGGASSGSKKYDAGAGTGGRGGSGSGGLTNVGGESAGGAMGKGGAIAADGGPSHDAPAGEDALGRPEVSWHVPDLAGRCNLDIVPLSPASLVDLTAGPTAFLRVQASITWGQTTPYSPQWTWSVVRSDGKAIVASPGVDPSIVQFPISISARYDITVTIGDDCTGTARALVQEAQNQYRLYRLRVLPPDSLTDGPVPYEVDLKIAAGSTQTTKDVDFDTGVVVAIDPSTGPWSTLTVAIPSAIRIQSSGSTWVSSGSSTNLGPFWTVLDALLEYQVLIVPDPPNSGVPAPPPPYLLNRATSDNTRVDAEYITTHAKPLHLPIGIVIAGHLTSADKPARGATISLHSYQPSTTVGQTDLLFSTVGQADSDGSYSLSVNPGGTFSIVLTPPAGAPLPTVSVDQGIILTDSSAAAPTVDFQWKTLPTADLQVAVALPGGQTPVDPVVVHLESTTGSFSDVGVLSVASSQDSGQDGGDDSAWTTNVGGVVRRDGRTDANGTITFPDLPKGPYQLSLAPPSSLAGSAITTLMIDTSDANDSVQMTVPLATKIEVMGRLLDAQDDQATDSAGATVIATDLGHDLIPNVVVTASVDVDGTYLLVLDPNRTYRLVAQPAAGQGLPAYVPLYGFTTGTTNMQLDDQRVPKGVLVHGHVTYAGSSVPGAIVQAFCLGLPPDCVDRNNLAAGSPPAFASTISNANGDYGIYLPDPATSE